ncbi:MULTISPECIES: hypothetical protein [Actinomadura]|uniref:Uncharacterized protein n=1 Tax=Actinomadura madurae TaxID=1993 RepID=A0A1I5QMB9_9ACTN|nr:hypothetical protein [Actinomadura madurae]SFP47016.1 hypothetical protein SAMN04489713_114181 [Actinomadura madurae]SPT58844.1 Uncharacterised protein [Actinomadura madurae]
MDKALANPRRTQIVAWPERRPADADSERSAETEATTDEIAAR